MEANLTPLQQRGMWGGAGGRFPCQGGSASLSKLVTRFCPKTHHVLKKKQHGHDTRGMSSSMSNCEVTGGINTKSVQSPMTMVIPPKGGTAMDLGYKR